MEKYILEKLFYVFNDDLKDSMEIFKVAKHAKKEGEHDLAMYMGTRAKQRIEMAENSHKMIERYLDSLNVKESPYEVFYDEYVEWFKYLKKEISEFRI